MKLLFILILGLIIKICQSVTFKVICCASEYGGNSVAVMVDGVEYQMNSNNNLYYKYEYEGTPTNYYYVVKSGAGNVSSEQDMIGQRQWQSGSTSTLNEVYGRLITVGDQLIKPIPRLYPRINAYNGFSILFQEGEIPVVNVAMSDADFQMLKADTSQYSDKVYSINFEIYTPYEEFKYTNGTLELSGMGSRTFVKKPFEIKFSEGDELANTNNDEIYDRSRFKLRSLHLDSSYIRNKIAIDMSESLGLPLAQSAHARLYINNYPFGLYELSDTYKKKFIRNNFYYGKSKDEIQLGSFYKGVSGAIPAFLIVESEANNVLLYPRQFDEVVNPMADLTELETWIASLTPSTPKSEIEKVFNLEMYLKYAVVEYLICHWDGYLINGNNFFVYREENAGKFHVFSFDFDLTFGKWCTDHVHKNFDDFVKTAPEKKKYGDGPQRYPALYEKLLSIPEIRNDFDELMVYITKNLFNQVALGDRIRYFKEFLKDDIIWDIKAAQNVQTSEYVGADTQNPHTFEDSQSDFDGMTGQYTSVLEYIIERSTVVATNYGFPTTDFVYGNKNGDVGKKIMATGETGSSINSDSASQSNHKYILEICYTLIFAMLVIMLGN